jgi:hypothetical protein
MLTQRYGPATYGIGWTIKQVVIREVLADKGIALCVDTEGQYIEVRTGLQRTGIKPKVGQSWLVDRDMGVWTFGALIAATVPSTDGGSGIDATTDVRARSFTVDGTVRAAFLKANSATQHAVTIFQASTVGLDVAAALNVVSDNRESTAMYLSGHELNRGTLKIAHTNGGTNPTADAGAAALSIDLKRGEQTGTAAQAIFINASEGPTTGNLVTIRNNGLDDFVIKATGRVGIGMAIGEVPEAALEIKPRETSAIGLAMTAIAGGQQLMLLRDSAGASRFEVSNSGATVHRAIAFFTSPIMGGSTSSDLGGSAGFAIGIKDVTTAPTAANKPTGGGVLFAQAGALKWIGSNGTITTLAPA